MPPMFFVDGKRRWGWVNPNSNSNILYLNEKAEEVQINGTSCDPSSGNHIILTGMTCIGEVFFCVRTLTGIVCTIPPEVQKWIDETRNPMQTITFTDTATLTQPK